MVVGKPTRLQKIESLGQKLRAFNDEFARFMREYPETQITVVATESERLALEFYEQHEIARIGG